MRSALLSVGIVVAASITGCSTIFGLDRSVILSVTEIAAPESIPLGTRLSAIVTVESGGCRRFDRLETERNASGATFTAWGRDSRGRNESCTADVRYDRVSAHFDPPFGSTFSLSAVAARGRMAPVSVTVRVE